MRSLPPWVNFCAHFGRHLRILAFIDTAEGMRSVFCGISVQQAALSWLPRLAKARSPMPDRKLTDEIPAVPS